jgi:hypothetical protein
LWLRPRPFSRVGRYLKVFKVFKKYFTGVGSGLFQKHLTRLERLAKENTLAYYKKI